MPRTSSIPVPYSTGSPTTRLHILRGAIGQELAELDAKEKVVMEPISRRRLELRRLRNRTLPIHKLPSELLIKIFTESPYTPWRRRDWYPDGQPGWLDLGWPCFMLVCRHWRDLLLSTPAFWREVNSKRQANWRALCLSRSAAASIDVYVEDCPFDRLDDERPHTHRFREFHFSVELDDAPVMTSLAPLFNSGMPLLEKLCFSVRKVSHMSSVPQIDAQLTSQRFPSLRALALTSAMMVAPQEISLYSQLRELSLDGCSPPLSFDGFLDVLAASVQLEELHLRGGTLHRLPGGWPRGGPIPYRPSISLPRLSSFVLSEYRIDRISCFLAHLRLRPSTVLCILGRVSGETTNTIDAMLPPNRSAVLPVLGLATNAHVSVRDREYTIGCGYVRPHDDPSGDSPQVLLELDPGNRRRADGLWDQAMTQGLDDLVQSFGPSPLTRLSVGGNQSYGTAAAWERVFRKFPVLEELNVFRDRDNAGGAANIFLGLHAASTTHTDSMVACPNLKGIDIDDTSTVETYEAMRDCFVYRGERGIALESLSIKTLIDSDDMASAARRGFIGDVSRVVKSIEVGYGLVVLEGVEKRLDDGWDEA